MKKLIYILTTTIFLLQGCSLVEVTDIQPPYQLSEENVITDIKSAEKVLTGAYAQLHQFDIIMYTPAITGSMGLSYIESTMGGAAMKQFYDNDVDATNYILSGIYTRWYYLVNLSSHIIEKTAALKLEDSRKDEIIAEAKSLRALAHFYLLRLFGEFYDTSSTYGIVLWDTPVKDVTPKPRSTVSDTYDLIIDDLIYATEHAPDYTTAIYASRQFAMGLLAKVYLYKKEYGQASTWAKKMIDEKGSVALEDDFAQIFQKWFRSKEVLLAPPFDETNERNNKAYAFRAYILPVQSFYDYMGDDNRRDVTIYFTTTGALRNGKFRDTNSGGQNLTANTEYFLRLAEVYLIYAEALVRSSSGTSAFDDARNAVNVIRDRVDEDLLPNTLNDKSGLLAAIFREKCLELGCESGEEWFDLVRFATEGDLDIEDYKLNVNSTHRYILPIPNASILASQKVVVQNIGYE